MLSLPDITSGEQIRNQLTMAGQQVISRPVSYQLLVELHLLACATGSRDRECRDIYIGELLDRSSNQHRSTIVFTLGNQFPYGDRLKPEIGTKTELEVPIGVVIDHLNSIGVRRRYNSLLTDPGIWCEAVKIGYRTTQLISREVRSAAAQ